MSDQRSQDTHDLEIYGDLITSLIRVILEDVNKINIFIDLEIDNKIKQLEAEKTDKLELLEEELRIITLRNRFLGRPNKIKCNSIEEEIDLRRQIKKKIDNIEKLDENLRSGNLKMLKY